MTAIPKEILPHSCTLMIYEKDGIFGAKRLISQTALSCVRLSLLKSIKTSADCTRCACGGTLYYDCTNSLPQEAEFLKDGCESVIVFDGASYRITCVKYIYCGSELHHLEIELGGVK